MYFDCGFLMLARECQNAQDPNKNAEGPQQRAQHQHDQQDSALHTVRVREPSAQEQSALRNTREGESQGSFPRRLLHKRQMLRQGQWQQQKNRQKQCRFVNSKNKYSDFISNFQNEFI